MFERHGSVCATPRTLQKAAYAAALERTIEPYEHLGQTFYCDTGRKLSDIRDDRVPPANGDHTDCLCFWCRGQDINVNVLNQEIAWRDRWKHRHRCNLTKHVPKPVWSPPPLPKKPPREWLATAAKGRPEKVILTEYFPEEIPSKLRNRWERARQMVAEALSAPRVRNTAAESDKTIADVAGARGACECYEAAMKEQVHPVHMEGINPPDVGSEGAAHLTEAIEAHELTTKSHIETAAVYSLKAEGILREHFPYSVRVIKGDVKRPTTADPVGYIDPRRDRGGPECRPIPAYHVFQTQERDDACRRVWLDPRMGLLS